MEEKSGRVAVKGGELFFQLAGAGETVVFLHGFALDCRMWEPQFEALRARFRVIAYDLRGFGQSSLPPVGGYAHEEDLSALLAGLGGAPAHVVGLSMGGRMALRFAAAYPEAVRSLVMADSALDGQTWSGDWQLRWMRMCGAAKGGDVAKAKRLWLGHPIFDLARAQPAVSALLERMVEDYSGWHWQNSDTAREPSPPLAERLAEIRVPSLVITGAGDTADFQAVANILSEGLPGAKRSVIEGAGHMVNLEAAGEFNGELEAFWGGLRNS